MQAGAVTVGGLQMTMSSTLNANDTRNQDYETQNETGHSVYIQNIPQPEYDRFTLKNMFSKIGKVISCYVSPKLDSEYTYGFVRYESLKEAISAVKFYDGMDLGRSKPLSVSIAYERGSRNRPATEYRPMATIQPEYSCQTCGAKCSKICSLCRTVYYCSSECQRLDFPSHRKVCNGGKVDFHDCRTIDGASTLAHQTEKSRNGVKKDQNFENFENGMGVSAPEEYEFSFDTNTYLVLGEEYDLNILKITKKRHFYAVLNELDVLGKLADINNLLDKLKFDKPTTLSSKKMFCVLHKNVRYRARPLRRFNNTGHFYLIDYGKKAYVELINVVEIIDSDLLATPALCICGTFFDIDSFDFYFERLKNKTTQIASLKLQEIRDGIHVFTDSVDISFQTSHSLLLNEIYEFQVIIAERWDQLIFRSADNASKIIYNSFLRSFSETPESSNDKKCKINVGDIVRCKISVSKWQRAKVMLIVGNQCDMFFIDTGEYRRVTSDMIDSLPSFLKYIPPLVFCCTLSPDLSRVEKESVVDSLVKNRETHKFKVKVIKKLLGGRYMIKVLNSEFLIGPIVAPSALLSTKFDSHKYTNLNVPIKADLQALVCHYESPTDFYVQICRKDYQLMMRDLHSRIDTEYKSNDPSPLTTVEVGLPVMCKTADQGFFRSLITEKLSDNRCKVCYVDFGISDVVSLEYLSSMPPTFMREPALAIKCRMEKSDLVKYPDIGSILKSHKRTPIMLEFDSIDSDQIYNVKISDNPN